MSFEDWDKRPSGGLAVGPLMGWQSAILPMTGVLRLTTARSPDQLDREELQSLQLAMTALQARELGQLLLSMAARIEAQPLGTAQ